MDNLQSSTYEVFERDPVKYAKYEEAIYQALCDRPEDGQTCVLPFGDTAAQIMVLMVKAVLFASPAPVEEGSFLDA